MKTPVTLRPDPDPLAAAQAGAGRDSWTLTNLLELAIKRCLGARDAAPVRDVIAVAPPQARVGTPG